MKSLFSVICIILLVLTYGCGKDATKHLAYETEMVCEMRVGYKSCIGQGIVCKTDYATRGTKCVVTYSIEKE